MSYSLIFLHVEPRDQHYTLFILGALLPLNPCTMTLFDLSHQRRKRLKRHGWMLLWALKAFGVKGGSCMMAQLLCFLLALLLKAMHITLVKQIMD